MNVVNTISMLGQAASTTPLAQAGAPQARGVAGFMAFLLQNTQAQATAPIAATTGAAQNAALQNLPPELQDFAAKIAELLNSGEQLTTADQTMLQKLIAATVPGATPELAAQIATTLQNGLNQATATAQGKADVKTGLTSDLAAKLATDIQQALQQTESLDAGATQDMAALLNGLEPQAGADADADADAAASVPLDDNILQALQQKIDAFVAQNSAMTAENKVQLSAEITQFLTQQNVDPKTVQQFVAGFEKSMQPQKMGATSLHFMNEMADSADGNVSANGLNAVTDDKSGSERPAIKITNNVAAQAQNAAANAAMQPQTNTANTNTTAKTMASHPAMIQAMEAHNSGSGMGGGDLGGQSAFSQNSNSTILDTTAMMRASSEAQPQNFINYMAGKGASTTATTQMVSLQIQRNAAAKVDTFSMQLDPAELGRMDVQLKFSKDGTIKAHLTVDKPETLALLQRDSSNLERMLSEAGLNVDENALSFDLRQQNRQSSFEGAENNDNDNGGDFANVLNGGNPAEKAIQAKIAIEAQGYISQSGVNIMV